jgi:hypothetical protein
MAVATCGRGDLPVPGRANLLSGSHGGPTLDGMPTTLITGANMGSLAITSDPDRIESTIVALPYPSSGVQTVQEGTDAIVRMATVAPDGPTGTFVDRHAIVPW